MPSQFFGLTIGYSGLVAAQAAENTTANNIANVNTEGYSRQKLTQDAAAALRTYTHYGMAGSGVDAKSIDQIRDQYIDMKYRANATLLGEYERKNTYMGEIEDFFVDSTQVPGFNTIYVENYYKALSDLTKDPGSVTTRASFIGQAKSVAEYFNNMAITLEKTQDNLNQEIRDAADRINSIAEQIASLNKQINVIEVRGVTANELRDQRENLVDELAKYVDVETKEVDVYNYSDPDHPTGAKNFYVTIGGACTLVDSYDYNTLECKAREEKINQSDIEGLYDLYWSNNGSKFSPLAPTQSGQLKSLLELRDGNNKEFFNGNLKDAVSIGDQTITVTVPEGHLTNLNMSGIPISGTITVSGFEYQYDSWKFEENANGTGTYTFNNISYKDVDHETVTGMHDDLAAGATVRIGQSIDYMGIPYYQAQMNEWVRSFASAFNILESRGVDLEGNSMEDVCFFKMVDSQGVERNLTPYYYEDKNLWEDPANPGSYVGPGTGYGLDGESCSYVMLTAKNFVVNSDIIYDARKMATTYNEESSTAVDARDLVNDLMSIKTDKDKMIYRGGTSAEFLQSILSDIALKKQSANTFEKNYTTIGQALNNQRLSVSGVDTDEEAMNLVKFQHAYELSAKVIQTMTEIYDRLILNTGV